MKNKSFKEVILASLIFFIVIVIFALIYWILPNAELSLISAFFALSICFLFWFRIWQKLRYDREPTYFSLTLTWLIFILIPIVFFTVVLITTPPSFVSIYWAIAMIGLTLTFFYDLLHLPLALFHKLREDKRKTASTRPPVTFIVPAYNEEKCISRTLISLLEIDYDNSEIIVVDDGSTDNTLEIASRFKNRGVTVLSQPNRGKAIAINTALVYAKGEIIVTVDADSLIERNGLLSVVSRFEEPKVMAVCGNVRVLNRTNLLTKCQALEYVMDINLAKRAFDLFGSTLVVPGVFGAFRKDVIDRSGRYDNDTLTEDFDITIKALKAGGVVQATSFAESLTEAPEKLRDFYKQRLRWYRGTTQTFLKHSDALHNPRYGFLSELGFPYILLSMIFVPLISLSSLLAAFFAVQSGFLLQFLILLGLFMLLETMLAMFSVLLSNEDMKLVLYAPLFVIGFKQYRDLIKLKAIFDVLVRGKFKWEASRRTGAAEKITSKNVKL